MRRKSFIYWILFVSGLLWSFVAGAQERPLGIGIVVGEPTGVAAKYWTDRTTALDAAVAWSFNHDGSFYVHADYLFHYFDIIQVSEGKFPLYWGFGAKAVLANKGIFGGHVPLGLSYMFERTPLDIFIEIRPGLNLLPATEFDMSGGIGVRYNLE